MITELRNPLTQTLITKLRDTKTDAFTFRHTINELTKQLVYEALQNFPTTKQEIKTWKGKRQYKTIEQSNIVVATVLRAGMPMLESTMELLPEISAGFLAIKRDEVTHKSKLYFDRMPECKGKTILLVDPMLATGGSMIDAIEIIKTKKPSKIIVLNIIGSPQGLEILQNRYKNIDIFIAKIDKKLNLDKYIIPGIGDAGDRAYNTPE